jgi:hypothetical protein
VTETKVDLASDTALSVTSSTRQQQQQHTAPTASTSAPSYAPTDSPPRPAAPHASTNKGKGNEKGKGKGNGKGKGKGGGGGGPGSDNTSGINTGGGGGSPAWPSFYPWTGSISMWPRPQPHQQPPQPQQAFLTAPGPFGPPGRPHTSRT